MIVVDDDVLHAAFLVLSSSSYDCWHIPVPKIEHYFLSPSLSSYNNFSKYGIYLEKSVICNCKIVLLTTIRASKCLFFCNNQKNIQEDEEASSFLHFIFLFPKYILRLFCCRISCFKPNCISIFQLIITSVSIFVNSVNYVLFKIPGRICKKKHNRTKIAVLKFCIFFGTFFSWAFFLCKRFNFFVFFCIQDKIVFRNRKYFNTKIQKQN